MDKRLNMLQAANLVPDGSTVMIGGFIGCGSPHQIIDHLVHRGAKDLTVICNDTGRPEYGIGKLVVARCCKKIIASHIGTNRETGRQMIAGELEVDLVPQGTLAERVRCAAYGLGGVLTRTGVSTLAQENKTVLMQDGVQYLLETALHADVALIAADTADEYGNLVFKASTRNFNVVMAGAATHTIAFVKKIVKVGDLDPEHIVVPGAFVDYIVLEEEA